MPTRPAFLYDGRCGFCLAWLEYARALLGDSIEWIAFDELGERFPAIDRSTLRESSIFVDAQVTPHPGASGIARLLACAEGRAWLLWLYRSLPPFRSLADLSYRLIAKHRSAALLCTKLFFGLPIRPLRYQLTESVFFQLLGICFFFAFWSLRGQILGLIGTHGLVPAGQLLGAMRADLGFRAAIYVPTIFWFQSTDPWLTGACTLGMIASALLVFAGWLGPIWQRMATLSCFVLYLSLDTVGEPFTSFQWDALLLETAFLVLFAGSPLLVWAFRLLAFRLMFQSGAVKLLSGDPNWRNLHALRFHFMTQPLPNPPAWYMYHAPGWLLDSLTCLTLFVELVCPLLLFMPRRIRHISAIVLIGLQVNIIATGNYAFFNLLTIAICLWAFDDARLAFFSPLLKRSTVSLKRPLSRKLAAGFLGCLMVLGLARVVRLFSPALAAPLSPLLRLVSPWQIVNSYGLFAVMTTSRPEIIFEGSDDGQTWKEYSFPYKTGDLNRPLPIVAPFQPRLDWQLWFAALDGNYREDQWAATLAVKLLRAEPQVLRLLEPPPFNYPPRYIRASIYEYWFTTELERQKTGAIWNRRFERPYIPTISLEMLQPR
jgi:predicted DCC family thiol-disulfide oxidoreductase YuxK